MPRCHISLGGNLGLVAATFEQALSRLDGENDCRVIAFSDNHETAPVGDQAGAVFLNAAAELETELPPLDLLDKLQAVEHELGRTREGNSQATRWGPRTLDLDLVFYGSQVIDLPRLVVPHPAAWYRRFVLDPLVDIAPRFVHPVKDVEIGTLRNRLLARPLRVSLAGGTPEGKAKLIGLLAPGMPAVEFSDWDSPRGAVSGPSDEETGQEASKPAFIFWLGPGQGSSGAGRSTAAGSDFEHLPPLPRIDATAAAVPVHDFVRYVIQSALG